MVIKSAKLRITCIGLILGILFAVTSGYFAFQYMGQTKQQRLDHLRQTAQIARNSIEPVLVDYRNNAISKEVALTRVRNLIRRMVYNDHTGKNYIFMSSYDGIMLVQPFEMNKELTDVWDLKDANGIYIIRSLVDAAKTEEGQGYVTYFYQRPGEASAQEKVSFVIGIPELNCYIGTGQYMADIRSSQTLYLFQIVGLSLILLILLYILVTASMRELRTRNMQLHKTEQELQAIFDNSFQFIGTLTPEGCITRCNLSALKFIDKNEADILDKPFWETPWWSEEEAITMLKEAVQKSATGESCRFECSHRSEKYGEIFVDFNLSPILNAEGQVVSLLAEGRDVSVQTVIRKDLAREKTFFNNVIESLPGLFYLFKREGNNFYLQKWNSEQFEKILGYPSKELERAELTDFIDEKAHDSYWKIIESLFEAGSLIYEFDMKTRGNKTVPILHMVKYFEFEKEQFIVGTGVELTEKIKAEEEKEKLEAMLNQSRKMEALGVLSGGIAHDFNNILSAVLGYAELAKMKLPKDDPIGEMQGKIINAAIRARDLVNQILLFSRQSKIEMKPVQLESVVKEVITLLRSTIPTTIEIKHSLAKELGVIFADATQLHQIIMNLCTNAYHAMRESGGVLTISLTQRKIHKTDSIYSQLSLEPGTYQVLEIGDSGTGMDRKTMDRIFDPYFTTKEKGDGTGLGLSVVHGIVKNYGGEIKVYSEIGRGSCFQIYLPEAVDQIYEVSEQQQITLQEGSERIMLVDDDSMLLEMTQQSLMDLGYQVSSFDTGEDALESFAANPDDYDLVITDMTMPKMTGVELSREVLGIRDQMPIILCTGYSDLITREKAYDMGIQAFLVKPLFREKLSGTIREVLDNRSN